MNRGHASHRATKRRVVLMAATLAGLGFSDIASAIVTLKTEDFTLDPGWLREGTQNGEDPNGAGHPHNFGFKNEDHTGNTVNPPGGTATGAGEAGGTIGSETNASYGDNIGSLTINDDLTVHGVVLFESNSQETQFGWYDSTGVTPPFGTRPLMLGFRSIGRGVGTHNIYAHFANAAGEVTSVKAFDGEGSGPVTTGTTYPFSIVFDADGGAAGNGSITLFFDGATSEQGGSSFTYELSAGVRANMAGVDFDRFGMTPSVLKPDGGAPEEVRYDDLTYAAQVIPSEWNLNGDGNWSVLANWTGLVPNGVHTAAAFGGIITGAHTVTVDGAQIVGEISFDNANAYTIAGGNAITLDVTGGNAELKVLSGSHTISAPLGLNDNTTVNVANAPSTLTISALQNSTVSITKKGAGKLEVNGVRAAGLNVTNGVVQMLPSGNTNANISRVATLSVGPAAKLDLTDNKLIVTTAGATGTWDGVGAYNGVAGLVDSGRGNAGNAMWDGASGIVTSDTRAINNGDLVSIGVAQVSEVRAVADTETTTFAGQTVLGSDTLAMVTWGGDANLDGKINIDDYGRIDGNVGQSGSVFGWSKGDFNYDGKINIDDYGIIDGNINRQGAPFATGGDAMLDGVAAVPEPASLGILIVAALDLMGRRRKKAGLH